MNLTVKHGRIKLFALLLGVTFLFTGCFQEDTGITDQSGTFFDDSYVHQVNVYIEDDDWYTTLYENHTTTDDPYEAAILEHEDYSFYPVGVRFKGSSSFSIGSQKKSFKFDVNEFFENCNIYDKLPECEELSFYGLKKMNFNNGFKDPSFLREKIFFDIAGKYFPTPRTIFVEIYVNDEYMGLYTAVEQPDDVFVEMNYGVELGNLFECEKVGIGDKQGSFGSDLGYLGEEEDLYREYYTLKTTDNTEAWESLMHFFDVLNNYYDDEFIEEIEKIADTDQFLAMLAVNNIFANYDSYSGSSHNYYIYEDSDGIFHPILWDGNEAFGSFSMYGPSDQLRASPLYGDGVLESRFFNIPQYKERYLEIVEVILEEDFNVENMNQIITSHADLIRDSVYKDTKKQYSDEEFESSLYFNGLDDEADTIEGELQIRGKTYAFQRKEATTSLLDFVQTRYESIQSYINN